VERKLTAILRADVVGYSRPMAEDKEATFSSLASHRKIIDSLIVQHRGRFVNRRATALAEFPGVVNGVQCGIEIQSALKAQNARLS
jgi:class 3 adenylate cyclase